MFETGRIFEGEVSRWLSRGSVVESLCGNRRTSAGVLAPQTAEDVQAIVRAAAKAQGVVKLQPISCGKNWGFGSGLPTQDGVYVLDLSGLSRIRTLDLRSHCAELEPGVTQGGLDEALQLHGGSHYFNVTGAGLGASVVGNALERGIGYSGEIGGQGGALEDLTDAINIICHRHYGPKRGSALVELLGRVIDGSLSV